MRLELMPPVSPAELAALEHALARAGIELEAKPARTYTGWTRAASLEAMDVQLAPPTCYARSPRSTPGATRA